MELPLLAGRALRGAGAHGRQRRPPQARLERPAMRACDRGGHPRCRVPAGPLRSVLVRAPVSSRSSPTSGIRAVTLTGSSDTGSRIAELAGVRSRRRSSSSGDRIRSSSSPTRTSRRDCDRRPSAQSEQRPVMHRRKAIHRRRVDPRLISSGASRKVSRTSSWVTRWIEDAGWSARPRDLLETLERQGPTVPCAPARGFSLAASGSRARATSSGRPCSRTSAPACPLSGKKRSGRGRGCARARRR